MSFIVIKPDILITGAVPFIPNKNFLVYLHNSHILKRPGLGKLGPLTHVYRMVSYRFWRKKVAYQGRVQQSPGYWYFGQYRSFHCGSCRWYGSDRYIQLFSGKLYYDRPWRRRQHRLHALLPASCKPGTEGEKGTDHCKSGLYRIFYRFSFTFWSPFRWKLCKSK